jgi:sulfide:quinone oxidoreductase
MTAQITQHTPSFATAPQLELSDLNEIAALGFKTIICNRPDDEGGPAQPKAALLKAQAQNLGLSFHHIPFTSGQLTEELVKEFAHVIKSSEAPVLAFCRSGARSTQIWNLGL